MVSTAPRTGRGYLPPLDGFRGLAVAMVFLYHAKLLPYGWIGVQLFFVLSGFLITRVLSEIRDLPRGQFLARFYWLRILLIWPVYLLFILAAAVLLFSFDSRFGPHLVRRSPYLLTFTFNFHTALDLYWNPPFSHLWSLSVEEQFYLVWPFLVFALARRKLFRACLVLTLLGPLIRLGLTELYDAWIYDTFPPERARGLKHGRTLFLYMLPFSHLDAFAVGALLSVLPERLRRFLRRYNQPVLLLAVGLFVGLGILSAVHSPRSEALDAFYHIHLRDDFQFLWGYTAINLLSAALIAALLYSPLWGRIFALPPLAWLGKISYGFYVYHPIVATVMLKCLGISMFEFRWVHLLGWLAVSLAISSLSYFAMERPILRLKRFLRFEPTREG